MSADDLPLGIPIVGFRVTVQAGVSDVRMRLARGAEEAELSFASAQATFTTGAGEGTGIPELVGAEVLEARCSEHVLHVVFGVGLTMKVKPARDYEAWEVWTPVGVFVGSPK